MIVHAIAANTATIATSTPTPIRSQSITAEQNPQSDSQKVALAGLEPDLAKAVMDFKLYEALVASERKDGHRIPVAILADERENAVVPMRRFLKFSKFGPHHPASYDLRGNK